MPENIKAGFILVVIAAIAFVSQPVTAQDGAAASLNHLNTQAFPTMEAYLDVKDSSGHFLPDLQSAQVSMVEDGNLIPVESLEIQRQGVQFVAVMNPAPSFGVRDSKGISRYDFMKGALEQWAKGRQGSNLDDHSLLITQGPSISHTSDAMKFAATLQSENINAREAIPSLDSLYSGVTVASDPTPRPGMGRVLLFITPPLEGQDISLDSLIDQARQQGVIIYVWMVTSKGTFSSVGVQRLNDLAAKTGGWVFTYTGEETLPNPEDYLTSHREIYHLTYRSGITSNGTHHVSSRITLAETIIETELINFEITLLPPVPAFVSPPIQIQRKPPLETDSRESGEISMEEYLPVEESLTVVFDFPDGRKRPFVRTALFVDGSLAAENTEPPFDHFIWNLRGYNADGSHLLRIEATDSLGILGSSVEIPVNISVLQSKPSPWSTIQRNLPLLAALAVLLSFAILVLVLITGGHLRPGFHKPRRRKLRKVESSAQPAQILKEESLPSTISNWVSRLQWPLPAAGQNTLAFLRPVDEPGEHPATSPIAITEVEVTIGRDPNLATLVLNDPSVDGLHARLIQQADGSFRLLDENSVAGTWINYSPINSEGTMLEHGDLLNFGRICFRFSLRHPGDVRKPVISSKSQADEMIEEPA
ncbi:MAG: hypothetical protein A2Z16_02690 [Chloroflexi bacterium RBG_16_54_18]|nr:MAG: hypothetical protein A2Z16_02690 [Chloroflexi bacterium RBG_16_54_18]